jgi:hypothetical protein
MYFEGGFIDPLRIHGNHKWLAHRLKYVDAQATTFGPRRSIHVQQSIPERRLFSKLGLKARNEVKNPNPPPSI